MKHFPILQGRCMVVELPEGASKISVDRRKHWSSHILFYETDDELKCLYLPPGTWQIVGMLTNVTEAQCRGLVDEAEGGYKGYMPNSGLTYKGRAFGMSSFGHAWKSLASAIFAAGYVFDDPKEGDYNLGKFEAQSRVLCRERCLLLRRVD